MSETSTGHRAVPTESIPPNTRRGGDIRLTLSPRSVGATSGFGGVLFLEPGKYVTEHYHPYSEEFLHVVSGVLEITIDGQIVPLGPGTSVLVPIGARHRLVNRGSEAAQGVFHLSPLAPRPDLGHVDTEQPLEPSAPHPPVAGI